MLKKSLFLCIIISNLVFAAPASKDSVEMRIKQFNEYKKLVDSNREKEIANKAYQKEKIKQYGRYFFSHSVPSLKSEI